MRAFRVLVACILCAGLVACSDARSDPSSTGASSNQNNEALTDVPEFTGPWAAEFADAYKKSESELARKILADSVITESEVTEIRAAEAACLEDAGFTEVVFNSDGTSSMRPPVATEDGAAGDLHYNCTVTTGSVEVDSLYNTIQVNPDNEDWDALNVQCLIETGVVEPSFTVADLDAWFANGDPRLLAGGEAQACTTDPLAEMNR